MCWSPYIRWTFPLVACVGMALWAPLGASAEPVHGATAAAAFKVTHALAEADGSSVDAALTVGADGRLYGTARHAGAHGGGTAFRLTPGGQLAVLHDFGDVGDGSQPNGLIRGADGDFYGTTAAGGLHGLGTVFRMRPDGEVTLLHSFQADGSDGWTPMAGLLQANDGHLYGTTRQGGTFGFGSVFRITLGGAHGIVHSFDNADGAYPATALIQASDGRLYGTTYAGGRNRLGTAFAMHTGGYVKVLHAFGWRRPKGGHYPSALVEGPDGMLYGSTTTGGDATQHGMLFRLSRDGEFSVFHDFNPRHGGHRPVGVLHLGRDGQFYGVTAGGGIHDGGVVYRISLGGTYTLMHKFNPDGLDGRHPLAGLVELADGEFYGGPGANGAGGLGTLYRIRPK